MSLHGKVKDKMVHNDPEYYLLDLSNLKIILEVYEKFGREVVLSLQAKKVKNDEQFDFKVVINKRQSLKISASTYAAKRNLECNTTQFLSRSSYQLDYILEFDEAGSPTLLEISTRKINLRKVMHSVTNGRLQAELDYFLSYHVFWGAINLKLTSMGMSFIHAAIVNYPDGSIVVAGTGGCGKTSTLFEAVSRTEVKYLSEDFGILDQYGSTHFCPKAVSIYDSDLKYKNVILQNAYYRLDLKRKILWNLWKYIFRKNPRIKVHPQKIGLSIALNSKVKAGFFVKRTADVGFNKSVISVDEFAERAVNASAREILPMLEPLYSIQSNLNSCGQIPSPANIMEKMQEVYLKCFNDQPCYLLEAPLKCSPSEVLKHMLDSD